MLRSGIAPRLFLLNQPTHVVVVDLKRLARLLRRVASVLELVRVHEPVAHRGAALAGIAVSASLLEIAKSQEPSEVAPDAAFGTGRLVHQLGLRVIELAGVAIGESP